MGQNKYEIEISEAENSMYIAAVNVHKHKEHYLIELELSKGKQILTEFKDDFKNISQNLQIISRRLVLLNPNMTQKTENSEHKTLKKHKKERHSSKKLKEYNSQRELEPMFDDKNSRNQKPEIDHNTIGMTTSEQSSKAS